MALITCEECGKEISSTAKTCPHCGHKTEYAKESAKKLDYTVAMYICLAAIVIGAILLVPALITLMENLNDWYFWNWYTERSDAVVRNISFGIGLVGGGLGVLLGLKKKAQNDTQNKNDTEE